ASLLAGLIMMVPFIGSFGAFVPPLLLVLLQGPNDQLLGKVLVLLLLLILAQQIALQLIAPRVFGKTLGVNPLILFAALLLGAKFGGVWGAFFAGPIVAVLYTIVETFYDRFAKTSAAFAPLEKPGDEPAEPSDEDTSAPSPPSRPTARASTVVADLPSSAQQTASAPERQGAAPHA